jgi:hypothetical protein
VELTYVLLYLRNVPSPYIIFSFFFKIISRNNKHSGLRFLIGYSTDSKSFIRRSETVIIPAFESEQHKVNGTFCAALTIGVGHGMLPTHTEEETHCICVTGYLKALRIFMNQIQQVLTHAQKSMTEPNLLYLHCSEG